MSAKRYFEWIAGENIGDVIALESIEEEDGEIFFNFDDGDRCNVKYISKMTNNRLDLKSKFLVEIESPSNPWIISKAKPKIYNDQSMHGQIVEIPSLNAILKDGGSKVNDTDNVLVEPTRPQNLRPLPTISEYGIKKSRVIKSIDDIFSPDEVKSALVVEKKIEEKIEQNAEPVTETLPVAEKEPEKPHEMNPVSILVSAAKKHLTKITMDIDVYLPAKSMYGIASSEFEDGGNKFIDLIVDSIEHKSIIDALKNALKNAYEDNGE